MDFKKIFPVIISIMGICLGICLVTIIFATLPYTLKTTRPGFRKEDLIQPIQNPVFKNYLIYCDDSNYLERRIDTAIIVDIQPRLVTSDKTIRYVVNKDTILIPYLRIRIKGQQIDWRSDGQ